MQSPTGFQPNDLIVAIGGVPAAAGCLASKVSGVSAADVNGVVTVAHNDPGAAATFGNNAVLLNMGPSANAQKVRYDVTGAGVLRQATHSDVTATMVATATEAVAIRNHLLDAGDTLMSSDPLSSSSIC